jgi:hypothetical protein
MLPCDSFLTKLSPELFWDVDASTVDPEKHAGFIIVRVMERGTHEEVRATWAYYGAEKVKESLVEAPALSGRTVAFFANQFDIPKTAFRAYERSHCWAQ